MEARPERSLGSASKPSSLSSTLLDQLRASRPEAWQRLVRLYGPVIYRWCRRSELTAEDSADVVQDVFWAVTAHLSTFRRDRPGDSFIAWLATITRNKVREHYRRRLGKAEARGGTTAQRQMAEIPQPEPAGDREQGTNVSPANGSAGLPAAFGVLPQGALPLAATFPGEAAIRSDAQSAACLSRRALDMIRAEFEVRTWEVFWRVGVGGESPANVAADLAISVAAVYKAKSRVLARFRQVLAELPE